MVKRNGPTSNIMRMPSYLKDYITEFNYLFHQIYRCRNQNAAQGHMQGSHSYANDINYWPSHSHLDFATHCFVKVG